MTRPNTERPSSLHTELDTYATPLLVSALVDDQINAVRAVQAAHVSLARAVDLATERLAGGGRLVYAGAGTSGRLGLLDSVELYPTFSWPPERAVALLAGGQQAIYKAVEGAEDSTEQGAADVAAAKVGPQDVVIALAASGSTPYVLAVVDAAKRAGALTIGIANNANSALAARADVGITLDTGSEMISGSTRLKAGTAQKITLNTLSSAIMVRLNKVYGNLMVDVKPTNAKLVRRSIALTMQGAQADEASAHAMLKICDFSVKTAIVALRNGCSVEQASEQLAVHGGSVRAALAAAFDTTQHHADQPLKAL